MSKSDTTPVKFDSLKAAVVSAIRRPHSKGDTIEYNVEHIVMQPRTVVEDLLRQLPGLRIDMNGNITYNGERIDHLLVDGRDLFGSTPTLITRNLEADKIALVQILDRKSDDATFTGIDDGGRTKTLNLVLKESARNGYFGKIEAGSDGGQYYHANGALASFRKREQFAAIGMTGNTGELNLSSEGGGIGFLYGISDPLGASAGGGIPKFSAIALHYANTYDVVDDYVDVNYQFSHFFSRPLSTVLVIQSEPDSIYAQSESSWSINNRDQHWVDVKYEGSPTVHSAIRFNFRGSNTVEQNQFGSTGSSTFNDTLVNDMQRKINDNMSRLYGEAGLAWRLQVGRLSGSVISVTSGFTAIKATTNGYLSSLIRLYEPNGTFLNSDTVDERKQILTNSFYPSATINYNRPLWNRTAMGFSYGMTLNSDRPFQTTYNRGSGQYSDLIDSLSSHLTSRAVIQRVTLNWHGQVGFLTYVFGNDWIKYTYHQYDLISDSFLHVHYVNCAPMLQIGYTPNQRIHLGFEYRGTSQDPSISQLAPIDNNNDPLHLTRGNPFLKPALFQNFRINFHFFSKFQFNVNLNLTAIANGIGVKTTIDTLGRQVSEPVNVDGGRAGSANIFIGRKISGLDVGVHIAGTYARSENYVNENLSQNESYTGAVGFNLGKYVFRQYSIQLSTNFTYFNQVSSVDLESPVRYWSQSHSGSVKIWFIPRLEIGADATYTWQERTQSFTSNTAVMIMNSYISRDAVGHRLVIKAELNNVFNANAGVSRSSSANINTETKANILGRYWLLSAIFHFDKKINQK